MKLPAFISLLLITIIIKPLAVVWSINQLFPIEIEYSISTWIAVVLLDLALSVRVKVVK